MVIRETSCPPRAWRWLFPRRRPVTNPVKSPVAGFTRNALVTSLPFKRTLTWSKGMGSGTTRAISTSPPDTRFGFKFERVRIWICWLFAAAKANPDMLKPATSAIVRATLKHKLKRFLTTGFEISIRPPFANHWQKGLGPAAAEEFNQRGHRIPAEPDESVACLCADEVRRLVDAPLPGVPRNLRIGTQRARAARYLATQCDDALGRDALFHPLLERGERIEGVRASTATAVPHPGRHEEAEEFPRRLRRVLSRHALQVVDAVLRVDARIVPAVVHDQLAAERSELAQVWVGRVDDRPEGVGGRDVLIEVEGVEVPVGIVE